MKELSVEQKAKAYDNVREKIAIRFGSNVVEEIFSEFEESKDERIRKAIINVFAKHKDYEVFFGASVEDILAWLEKQGETSPVLSNSSNIGKDEHKPWNEEDDDVLEDVEEAIINYWHGQSQEDLLDWLKSLKDRVQPKQEWDEDDEYHKNIIIKRIEGEFSTTSFDVEYRRQLENALDWLKSLRPQSRWKPTDEQMDILLDAIVYVEGCNSNFKGSGRILENLYSDLIKLKG